VEIPSLVPGIIKPIAAIPLPVVAVPVVVAGYPSGICVRRLGNLLQFRRRLRFGSLANGYCCGCLSGWPVVFVATTAFVELLVWATTLAEANESRDWRIYAELAQRLMLQARKLYAQESLGMDLDAAAFALDSTTIDLCLSLFPWAHFRSTKSAVKMHTLLDLRGNIPSFIRITTGDVHDVNILDEIPLQFGAYYILDRGYLDFFRLHRIHLFGAFFVTRAKSNLDASRLYSRPADKQAGILADQSIALNGYDSRKDYPSHLRRIRFRDPETGKSLVFLTNQFNLPAATICALYKSRWQVELFFKWIKQHLRIKAFYGTSENAVKTQLWIAISVYLLVAIVKKRLNLPGSLYTLLQVISVTLFEKMPISQALQKKDYDNPQLTNSNQLILFDF